LVYNNGNDKIYTKYVKKFRISTRKYTERGKHLLGNIFGTFT